MDKSRLFIATFSKDAVNIAGEYGIGLEINDLCISENLNPENRNKVIDRITRELSCAYTKKLNTGESPQCQKKFNTGESPQCQVFESPQSPAYTEAIIHGPFTELTPASIDPRAIELMDSRYDETIEICEHFGVKRLVLHDGFIPLIYQKPWHKKKSVDYWKRLSDRLPAGMTVYIENVFDDEPELLAEILEEVNRDNMRICLDVGHANCMTIPEFPVSKWIEVMAPHIGHFHLHNNDGTGDQHNQVFEGTLDMAEIIRTAEKYCSPDTTFTIESREAKESVEYLLSL